MVLCPNSGKRGSALRYLQFGGTEEGRRQAVFWLFFFFLYIFSFSLLGSLCFIIYCLFIYFFLKNWSQGGL